MSNRTNNLPTEGRETKERVTEGRILITSDNAVVKKKWPTLIVRCKTVNWLLNAFRESPDRLCFGAVLRSGEGVAHDDGEPLTWGTANVGNR